ncbi:substrate-binding domain-containing protein, partial [Desulfonatronospira sp.]
RTQRLTLKHFKHVCLSESNQAIKSMVKAGMGFSLMPEFMVRQELQDKEVIPMELEEGGLEQGFYMVYRKQEGLPEIMYNLIDYIALKINKNITPAGREPLIEEDRA